MGDDLVALGLCEAVHRGAVESACLWQLEGKHRKKEAPSLSPHLKHTPTGL